MLSLDIHSYKIINPKLHHFEHCDITDLMMQFGSLQNVKFGGAWIALGP